MKLILNDTQALGIYLGLYAGDLAPLEDFVSRLQDPVYCEGESQAELMKLLHELLGRKECHGHLKRLLQRLDPETLLEDREHEEHFLERFIAISDESWALEFYRVLCACVDLEEEACLLVDMLIPPAYRSGKYELLKVIYTIALQEDISYDNALMDGWHPLCFAARIGDTLLADTFLRAMEQADYVCFGGNSLLVPPGWRLKTEELDPDYNTTILEEIAMSGSVGVMALVLDHGAQVNARNYDGKTLLDVAKHPDMIALLKKRGGVPSTRQERLLFSAHHALHRVQPVELPWSNCSDDTYLDSCIRMVLQYEKPLVRMDVRFGDRENNDHCVIDLLLSLAEKEQPWLLGQVYGAVKDQLDEAYNFRLVKATLGEGPFGGFYLFDRDYQLLLDMLKALSKEGLHTLHKERGKTVAQLAIREFLSQSCHDTTLNAGLLYQFCRVLCRFTGEQPLSLVEKACFQLENNGEFPDEKTMGMLRRYLEQ